MRILPARRVVGSVVVPGDKSISHRIALIASIAEGITKVTGFATSIDCRSSLHCLSALGVEIKRGNADSVTIKGAGLNGLKPPSGLLDAGNSGSTIRMLSGILAGQSFTTEITGDESLERRPMKRIIEQLTRMGARIAAREDYYEPLRLKGSGLRAIE